MLSKASLLLIVCVIFSCACNAQVTKKSKVGASKGPLTTEEIADMTLSFTWDIEKEDGGSLMFLDVPYEKDSLDSIEYITLAVAKASDEARPTFISVVVPDIVDKPYGVLIEFTRTDAKKGEDKKEPEAVKLDLEDCKDGTCTARMMDGYAAPKGEQVDVFDKFMNTDYVLVRFMYPNGSYKNVDVPLKPFKEQYSKLE